MTTPEARVRHGLEIARNRLASSGLVIPMVAAYRRSKHVAVIAPTPEFLLGRTVDVWPVLIGMLVASDADAGCTIAEAGTERTMLASHYVERPVLDDPEWTYCDGRQPYRIDEAGGVSFEEADVFVDRADFALLSAEEHVSRIAAALLIAAQPREMRPVRLRHTLEAYGEAAASQGFIVLLG